MHRRHLWSDILARPVTIQVTSAALREIDRHGGLDNYLCNSTHEQLASEVGSKLKKIVERARAAQSRSASAIANAGLADAIGAAVAGSAPSLS